MRPSWGTPQPVCPSPLLTSIPHPSLLLLPRQGSPGSSPRRPTSPRAYSGQGPRVQQRPSIRETFICHLQTTTFHEGVHASPLPISCSASARTPPPTRKPLTRQSREPQTPWPGVGRSVTPCTVHSTTRRLLDHSENTCPPGDPGESRARFRSFRARASRT